MHLMFRIAEFTGMINSLHPIAWPANAGMSFTPHWLCTEDKDPDCLSLRDKSLRSLRSNNNHWRYPCCLPLSSLIGQLTAVKVFQVHWLDNILSKSISSSLIGQMIIRKYLLFCDWITKYMKVFPVQRLNNWLYLVKVFPVHFSLQC